MRAASRLSASYDLTTPRCATARSARASRSRAADKLRIAERLDALGVAFIEGGWPGSNPKDAEFFARARDATWTHADDRRRSASTRRAGRRAATTIRSVRALARRRARASCTHLRQDAGRCTSTDVLRTTLDENLR